MQEQEGGRLTVCTRLDDSTNKIEIIFKSTGDEIGKEYRDKIFGPFSTTIDDEAGIGLSASHDIVSNYDGDISFKTTTDEEDEDRKGSTFTVVLPAVSLEK